MARIMRVSTIYEPCDGKYDVDLNSGIIAKPFSVETFSVCGNMFFCGAQSSFLHLYEITIFAKRGFFQENVVEFLRGL